MPNDLVSSCKSYIAIRAKPAAEETHRNVEGSAGRRTQRVSMTISFDKAREKLGI